MSARVERKLPTRSLRTEQVIVSFDPEQLKAPFLLRCGAILIDYIILIAVPVISLLLYKFTSEDSAKILNNKFINAGWLIMILLAMTNFVFLPLIIGQSIGKMLTGLRVVKKDGNLPTIWSLCLRHLIGYPLTAVTLGLGFFLSVFNHRGRALHDLIAGTVVIYGKRQIVRKDAEMLEK